MTNATPTPHFALPPYHVEHFPIGSAVMNRNGFNCLSFPDRPGAKFTSPEAAAALVGEWNSKGAKA